MLINERNLSITGAQWYYLASLKNGKKLSLKSQPQGTSNHFVEYQEKIKLYYRSAVPAFRKMLLNS